PCHGPRRHLPSFPTRRSSDLTVLHKDGAIEMSYDQLAAKDAIVGIYPLISPDAEKPESSLSTTKHAPSAAHLDIQKLKLSVVGGDRKSTRLNSSHVAISYAVF